DWRTLQHQLHSSSKEWSTEFFSEIDLKPRSTSRRFWRSDTSQGDSSGVVSADLNHVGPITRLKFKNRAIFASVFFGEYSQSGSNFGESEDSMDSPTSMNVNALMSDSIDMDEKFAMMDQTIEALKKSIDDKNLYIAQLMNKLETFTPGESSHDVEQSLAKSKFQKEKQSASVAALSIQQLQDMITNTIRAQYGGTPQTPNQKKCSRSQIMPNTISLQFGSFTPIEVDFPKKTSEGSLEIHDNEADGWTLVTHKKPRHQEVLRIRLPKTRTIRSDVNQLQQSQSVKPCTSQKINGSLSQKMSKKTIKEVSIKVSPSKGDIQSNIDNEKPMFRYIPCERRKKGQQLPKECTQQVHPPRKELCHTTFQDLKEKMIVPVAQVLSIPLDSSKGNTQFGKIKGNFHQKIFTLYEKSSYNFSNPTMLGELSDEVIGEKIDGLTKSQMWLRKKGYYVATPRFGLGFSLSEPFWISSKKEKEITTSHHTSIEKNKGV
ncbi:hypothetical protein H5410_015430, partial [Solanum commersonii]